MASTAGESPSTGLGELLERLDELLGEDSEVAELRRQLAQGVLRLLVTGEAKRGKSTLVNALVGRDILPSGVAPVTALTTTAARGDSDGVAVEFLDGRSEWLGLDALPALVTEDANPENIKRVASVRVELAEARLPKNLEVVDTPGVGSVHEHNTVEAEAARGRMDAAIFVLTADPPISQSERILLRAVREQAVAIFCVLNKADRHSHDELDQALRFTRQVLLDVLGAEAPVWPLSARSALAAVVGGDDRTPLPPDWAAFESALREHLDRQHSADLHRSLARRAMRRLLAADEAAATEVAALAMPAGELAAKAGELQAYLGDVDEQRFTAVELARARLRKLLAVVNDGAHELIGREMPPLVDSVARWLAEGDGNGLAEVERDVLDRIEARIRALVEAWRAEQTAAVREELAGIDRQLAEALNAQVSGVRATAARLFGVEVPARDPLPGVLPTSSFRFSFAIDPGNVEALAAVTRTHLPGRWGRRRVGEYAVRRATSLLERQVGRARAEFQRQLSEVERALLPAFAARFDEGAGYLQAAVQRASAVRSEREAAAKPAMALLVAQREGLAEVSRLLAPLAAG